MWHYCSLFSGSTCIHLKLGRTSHCQECWLIENEGGNLIKKMLVTRHGERRNVYTRDPEMANSNYKIAIGSQIKCLKGKERPGKSSTHTKWVHQCLTTPQVPVTRPKLMALFGMLSSARNSKLWPLITVSNKASLQNQFQNSCASDPEESNEAFDRAIRGWLL